MTGQVGERITVACSRIGRLWASTERPPRTVESQTRMAYGPRLPGRTDVLVARAEATRDLQAWARFLVERLDLHPGPGGRGLLGSDVPALVVLIGRHADSLAILDGERAAATLERHARVLEEIVTQARPARIRVGDCPRCDVGVLYASIRPTDPDQLGSVVACDNRETEEALVDGVLVERPVCGASWASFEWRACWREVTRVHGRSGRRRASA